VLTVQNSKRLTFTGQIVQVSVGIKDPPDESHHSSLGISLKTCSKSKKSFEKLNPDILIVLGDIFANGWKSTNKQWFSVLHQFQDMMDPSISVPLYIVVGDRDVGGYSETNRLVDCAANSLPRLKSTACGSFSVSNVNFVSLNAIATACDQDNL